MRRTDRLDEAHRIALMGVDAFPNNSNLRVELGRVLIEKNEYELAEKELKQAIRDDDSSVWAYANLALLSSERGLIADAIGYYKKAVKMEPNNSEFLHNLAVLHAQSGHVTEAEKWFRRTLLIGPNNLDSMFQFSAFLVAQGRLDEVLGFAERIYEDNKNYPNIRTFYAICLALSENLDKMAEILGITPGECPDDENILGAVIIGEVGEMFDAQHVVGVDDDDGSAKSTLLKWEVRVDRNTMQDLPHHLSTIERIGPAQLETATEQGVQWSDTCLEHFAVRKLVCSLEGHSTQK